MAQGYEREGPLGEGGEVRERGLFGGHHGRRNDYDEAGEYASQNLGSGYGPPQGGAIYEGQQGGGGYGPGGYGGGGYGGGGGPGGYGGGGPGYGGGGAGYGGGYVEGGGYGDGYEGGGYGAQGGEVSDLGQGLEDSNIRARPDYGSSLQRPDLAGVPIGEYEGRGRHGGSEEAEYEEERRHKRYAEAAAAAAVGYGLHERHERREDDELGYGEGGERRHGLFRRD